MKRYIISIVCALMMWSFALAAMIFSFVVSIVKHSNIVVFSIALPIYFVCWAFTFYSWWQERKIAKAQEKMKCYLDALKTLTDESKSIEEICTDPYLTLLASELLEINKRQK